MNNIIDQVTAIEQTWGMCASVEELIQESAENSSKAENSAAYRDDLLDENPILKQKTTELEVISDIDYHSDSSDLESENKSERGSELDIVEEQSKNDVVTHSS